MKKQLDAKDWIIVRLLRLLLQSGQFASNSDVIRSIDWMNDELMLLGVVAEPDLNYYQKYGLTMHHLLRLMDQISAEFEPKPLPKHWSRS